MTPTAPTPATAAVGTASSSAAPTASPPATAAVGAASSSAAPTAPHPATAAVGAASSEIERRPPLSTLSLEKLCDALNGKYGWDPVNYIICSPSEEDQTVVRDRLKNNPADEEIKFQMELWIHAFDDRTKLDSVAARMQKCIEQESAKALSKRNYVTRIVSELSHASYRHQLYNLFRLYDLTVPAMYNYNGVEVGLEKLNLENLRKREMLLDCFAQLYQKRYLQ